MALNIFEYLSFVLTVVFRCCTTSKNDEYFCLRCFNDISKFEQNISTMIWSLNYNTNNETLCSIYNTTANQPLLNISIHQGESEHLKFTNEYYFCHIKNGNICFYRGLQGYPNKFKCQMTSPVEETNMFDINWQAICKCLFNFNF